MSKSNIQKIRELLRVAKPPMEKDLNDPIGCCRITMGGSTTVKSNCPQSKCNQIANQFPGATVQFQAGASCS